MPTVSEKVKPRAGPSKKIAVPKQDDLDLLFHQYPFEPSENPKDELVSNRIEMILFLPYFLGLLLFLALTGKNAVFLLCWIFISLLSLGFTKLESFLFDLVERISF